MSIKDRSVGLLIKDRLQIASQRTYTDEGFLITNAKISRTGIQDYYAFELGLDDRDPTDIIKIFRSEEEVFSEDSLQSFANKTITDNHPPEMITVANAKQFAVGHSGNTVTRDGDFAEAILHFTDQEIIKKVESGKVELSNGYTSDLEWTPGVTSDGENYDAVQKNIRGNHIAVVDSGRCGASCSISDHSPAKKEISQMAKITIDGVDFEVDGQAAQAFNKQQMRLDEALETIKEKDEELKKKEDQSEEELEKLRKKKEEDEAKTKDALAKIPTPEMLDALVDNRIATRDAAVAIMPDIKWEGKDCETLRKEVVSAKCENIDANKVSVDYIKARFDQLAEQVLNDPLKELNDSFSDQHKAKDTKKELTGRDKFVNDTRDAWKPKGGTK